MGFSDNLTEMATDLAQSVAATSKRLAEAGVATSKRVAEIAKLSASNLAEEGGIKKAYVELGKLYYAEHGATPDAGYAAACEKIAAAKATIEANNERIAQLKAEAKADGEVIDADEVEETVEAEELEETVEATEPEAVPTETDALNARLAAQEDKYLRLAAEYDNFRKRSQREREQAYTDAVSRAVTALLPTYDNLERALKAETADAEYKKGVELTMTQLTDSLKGLNVTVIEASAGTTFDPNFHNAVMHVEDEALGESVIAEVFQQGFQIGDKVIRHAMVKVAN